MRRILTEVHSLALDALGTPSLRLRTPLNWHIAPGQAVLVDLGESSGLPSPRFPSEIAPGRLSIPLDTESSPRPGMGLRLAGPIGRGFRPPPGSRRWLLSSCEAPPLRLLPLLTRGMEHGIEIVFAGPQPTHRLPSSIEIVSGLDQAMGWADYLALDTSRQALPALLASLAAAGVASTALAAEILVEADILCGWGGCGGCAVSTAQGAYLACSEGPVRPLSALLERRGRRGA